jgi:hypothetical protein
MLFKNLILVIFSILLTKLNLYDAACLTTETLEEDEQCFFYQDRYLVEDQTNLVELNENEIGNSEKASDKYSCCDVCILNKQMCNVFVYDENQQKCTQYKLVIKNEGSLFPYIEYSPNNFVGGIVSFIRSN